MTTYVCAECGHGHMHIDSGCQWSDGIEYCPCRINHKALDSRVIEAAVAWFQDRNLGAETEPLEEAVRSLLAARREA